MEILNVIELENGILSFINSFPILDGDNKKEKVFQCELFFINLIENNLNEKLSNEEKEEYLSSGYYDNQNGDEIYLSWSLIN